MALPYVTRVENTFYSLNGPAFSRPRGNAAAATSANNNDENSSNSNQTQKFSFNKGYVISISGITRMALMAILLGGIIAAALVPKGDDTSNYYADFMSTRAAYLFFTIFAFIVSVIYFFVNATNIVNLKQVKKLPWHFVVNKKKKRKN
jgi:hypothetical protein